MTGRTRRFRIASLVLTVALGWFARDAAAVIGMTPLRADVYARPGLPESFELTLLNTTPTERNVVLRVRTLHVDERGVDTIVEDSGDVEAENAGFADGFQANAESDDPQRLITFEGGNLVTLAPNEQRILTCYANLAPGTQTEQLAVIIADPGPEEMPLYGNTNVRIKVVFRVGVQVLVVPGIRRTVRRADGTTQVVVERMNRPNYSVALDEATVIPPSENVEKPGAKTLHVRGMLNNLSNTFITPLITAQLRNLTTRQLIEETRLDYGFKLVMGQTKRRFTGKFASPMEPGEYRMTVEVDWGQDRRFARKVVEFTLTEPIEGDETASQGVLSITPSDVSLSLRPGERMRGKLEVRNNYSETIRVTPSIQGNVYADWFRFSPTSLILQPGRTRDLYVTISADKDAPADFDEVSVPFVPTTISGTAFTAVETQEFKIGLRVLEPETEVAIR